MSKYDQEKYQKPLHISYLWKTKHPWNMIKNHQGVAVHKEMAPLFRQIKSSLLNFSSQNYVLKSLESVVNILEK